MTDPAAPNGATGGTFSPPAVMPAGIPHPNLLEHLGSAYVATPDGMITWHNDAFLFFPRAAWNLANDAERVTAAPKALSIVFDALISTGHFEPARTRAEIGGAPPEAHLGKHVLSLGSLPDPAPGVPDLKLLMQDQRPFRNRLFIRRDETSQSRRIHLSGTPFFDTGNGRFLGYRGTGADVTRALEAERDVISARQKLEQALSALELRNEKLRDTLVRAQSASDAKTDFLALASNESAQP
jgi:PAS domain-containing protein